MQKQIFDDVVNDMERLQLLKDNCDVVENKGYMKKFNEEELNLMKENLSECCIEINDIEQEKKEVNEGFKSRLSPIEKKKTNLLTNLKMKSEHVVELCYKFIDLENKEVGFYNAKGELIDQRTINADEMQGTIFQINRGETIQKTGTNN